MTGPGIAQWVSVRTPNPGYRVRFPVMSGSLFHFFGDVLGCVWECFGSVFGWLGQEGSENVENLNFEKMSGGICPASGAAGHILIYIYIYIYYIYIHIYIKKYI